MSVDRKSEDVSENVIKMSGENFRKYLHPKQTNSIDNWLCPQPRLASEAKRKPSIE